MEDEKPNTKKTGVNENEKTLPQAHESQLAFTRRDVSIRPQVNIRLVIIR